MRTNKIMHVLTRPKNLEAIFDYASIDHDCMERYTFIFEPVENYPYMHNILGTSYNGIAVSLWNQLENEYIGAHLGKSVSWEEISDELKAHVYRRLELNM